jgi:Ni/Co efflux regulator RcnB
MVVYWDHAMNFQGNLMDKKHLVITTLAAALLSASAAGFAQDRNRGDRDDHRYEQRDNRDNRGDHRGNDRSDRRDHRDDRRDDRSYQGRDNQRWSGAGPDHNFQRGQRLPDRYRNNQYVVSNWREHRLRQPPRGYHWVQTGGDYVLAAIATGLIADLIINH